MDIGLVGLPATGKTTIFNRLTGGSAATSAAGWTGKSERNVGVAKVADPRVDFLSDLYRPERTIHARIQFIDLPGLSREVQEKLSRVRPANLGQAGRISGVTPAALAVVSLHLHRLARSPRESL